MAKGSKGERQKRGGDHNPSHAASQHPDPLVHSIVTPLAEAISGLFRYFGLPGLIIGFVWWVLSESKDEQKQEFVDMWFLFKSQSHTQCIFIILILLLAFVFLVISHKRTVKFLTQNFDR